MIDTNNFKNFGNNTLPDYLFIVVPRHKYGCVILFDSIHFEFVKADSNNVSINNLLSIDEAIDQDFISRKEYVECLIDLNLKHINDTIDNQLPKNQTGYCDFSIRQYKDYKNLNIKMPIQFYELFYKKNRRYFNEGDWAYLRKVETGSHDGYDVLTFEREDGKIVKMRSTVIFYAKRHPNIKIALKEYIVNTINNMNNFLGGIEKVDICIYNIAQRVNLYLFSNKNN